MKVKLLNDIRPRWSSPGRALLLLALVLLPFTALAQTSELTGSGTSDEPYLISSKADWDAFATKVSGGETTACAKLTQDINLGEGTYDGMIGTSDKPYSGTFDGQGHTVTVNYTADQQYVAPFRYISGATIKNLHTAGTFTVSNKFVAGIVASATTSASTIENCQSSVTINSSANGDGTHGGLVAVVNNDGSIAINDCIFDGSITGSSTTNCGGLTGWVENSNTGSTITNCLQAGTFSLSSGDTGSYTFARARQASNVTVSNSYYLNALGTVQGTAVTDDQLASGEVAWNLQNGQATQAWGQTLTGDNKDATPVQTTDASKRVYKVTYQYENGDILATQFSNATMDNLPDAVASKTLTLDGEAFTASTTISNDVTVTIGEDRTEFTPSISDVTLYYSATLTPTVNNLPDDYKGAVTYTSDKESVVSVNDTVLTGKAVGEATITAMFAGTGTYKSATTTFKVTVSLNKEDIDGEGTEASPYLIKTTNGWNDFAQLVALGNTKVYAKLANDLNLGEGTYDGMIGTSDKPYSGTFDGQGHTVTVNYTADQQWVAPFRYISGATIKNLHTAGTFTVSNKHAAGIVGQTKTAKSTIENCRSSVNIVSSVSGGMHGGLVVDVADGGSVAIEDCIFDGSITGSSTTNCGGFIGWVDNSGSTITNCLQAGTFSISSSNAGSYTFSRMPNNVAITNSYYLNALGTVNSGATQVTAEQLSSGEVAYKLQNSRSEQAWGQTLIGDNKDATPVPTADASKRVYKVTYQYDDGVVLATQYSNATRDNLPDAVASKTLTLDGEAFTASTTISNDVTVTVGEDRKEVTPSISDVSLDLGATLTPTVNGLPDDYNGTVTYTSGNESVVSVNGTVLTGKAVGEATITATFAATDTYKSATTTFKVTVSLNKEDIDGEGTEASPYLIKTANGWNAFAQLVAAGNTKVYAKLANDIETVSTMACTATNKYAGTFDGQSHTVTVNYNTDQQFAAPFRYVNGATIKNLRVAGTISTSAKNAAGIVGQATTAKSTIENCRSSVAIVSSVNGDGTHGGLVADVSGGGSVAIKDCIFDGSISGSSTNKCAGFIGWVDNSGSTITNCLQAGTFSFGSSDTGSYTFARTRQASNLTVSNSYYLNALGTVNSGATKVTAEQLSSGEVAYKLQNSHSEQAWGQTLTGDNKDAAPVQTADASKRVYKVTYQYENGDVLATQFSNATRDNLPDAVASKTLTLDGEAFTASTTISKDVTVTVSINKADLDGDGTEASPYLIKTANGWNDFAQLVAAGNTKVYAKLANDISGVSTMVGDFDGGNNKYSYGGTFDGDGHTMTLDITTTTARFAAPFAYVNGATIKNLKVAGTISTSKQYAGSIVGRSDNADNSSNQVTITNCESSVVITSSISGEGTHGGLVGNSDGPISIENSIFSGQINGASTTRCGGFIGWTGQTTKLTNCLLTASFGVSATNSATFTGIKAGASASMVTITNCYYKNALGTVQGTAVTDDQLASGEVAWNLQNGQTTQVWGQTVGTDNMPQLTSDEDKHVYNNVFGSENVYDNYVVINEDKDNAGNIAANNNGRVKVVRSFAADTWNTLVLPFALTTDEVNTAFGSDAKVTKFTNNTANTIELNYDETGADKAIEANTPVLIRVTSAVSNPTFSSRNISSSDSPQVSGSNGINFIGSYAASYTIQEGEYFISGDKLWKSQGNSTIKATRAYFTVPAEQQAKLAFSINGDVVTGIEGVMSEDGRVKNLLAPVYNLSGQKVADSFESHNLPKGIYIVNGKKVTVK